MYYVLVVEPSESQFLSSMLGWHVGAAGARINYDVRGMPRGPE